MIEEQSQVMYSLEVQARVAQRIGDDETKKIVTEEMVKTQKRLDAFEAELNEA